MAAFRTIVISLESEEKKLLDGFLAGRDRIHEEVGKSATEHEKLF